jgi:hypothetical protein
MCEVKKTFVGFHSFIHSSQCQNICDVYDDGSLDISSVRDVIVINYDKYTTHILTF